MIKLESQKANFNVLLPESDKEITADVLNQLIKEIKIPKYYAIVALCFKTNLFDFTASISNKKDASLKVTTRLAGFNTDEKVPVNANVGDKVIVTRSAIERAVHINVPTMVASDNISNYIIKDMDLYKSILNLSNPYSKNNIVVLQFKVMPITDISAAIAMDRKVVDPYIETTTCK